MNSKECIIRFFKILIFILFSLGFTLSEEYETFRYVYIGKYFNFQIVYYDGRCTFCLERVNDNTYMWNECNKNVNKQRYYIVEKQKLDHYQIKSYYDEVYLNYNGLIDFYVTPASNEGDLKIFVLETKKCINFNALLYTNFDINNLFDECDKNYYTKMTQKFKFIQGGYIVNHFTAKGRLKDNYGNIILGKYLKNFLFYKEGVDAPETPGGYYQAPLNDETELFEFFIHKGTHSYTFENNLPQTDGFCKYLRLNEPMTVIIDKCTQEYLFTLTINDSTIFQDYIITNLPTINLNDSSQTYLYIEKFEMRDNLEQTIFLDNITYNSSQFLSKISYFRIKPTILYGFWFGGQTQATLTNQFKCVVPKDPLTIEIPHSYDKNRDKWSNSYNTMQVIRTDYFCFNQWKRIYDRINLQCGGNYHIEYIDFIQTSNDTSREITEIRYIKNSTPLGSCRRRRTTYHTIKRCVDWGDLNDNHCVHWWDKFECSIWEAPINFNCNTYEVMTGIKFIIERIACEQIDLHLDVVCCNVNIILFILIMMKEKILEINMTV